MLKVRMSKCEVRSMKCEWRSPFPRTGYFPPGVTFFRGNDRTAHSRTLKFALRHSYFELTAVRHSLVRTSNFDIHTSSLFASSNFELRIFVLHPSHFY